LVSRPHQSNTSQDSHLTYPTDIDNPLALGAYFSLLLHLTHILNAIVLSRGQQNDQTLAQARAFLTEYRSCVMSLFKRSARIGVAGSKDDGENEKVLEELVDALTVLMAASGFLESEQPSQTRDAKTRVFT
jgi:nuclear pore complex protein Nup205